MFAELLLPMLSIHQSHYGIQHIVIRYIVIHKEGLGDWARIGDSSGLNYDTLKANFLILALLPKLIEGVHQIATNRAADATIAHLHNVFLIVLNQDVVIDIFFAELVFDHSNFFAMLFGEDMLEEGSFAATQKARENRYWN